MSLGYRTRRRVKGKPRIIGFLEPLLMRLPRPCITRLSQRLNVTRMEIYRWQIGTRGVSRINRMKINMLCLEYGIKQLF